MKAVKELQRTVGRSLGSRDPPLRSSRRPADRSLHCAVLDRVVVSDVYPDEVIQDIIEDIIDNTTGVPR